MCRFYVRFCVAGLLAVVCVWPALAQKSGGAGSGTTTGTGTSGTTGPSRPSQPVGSTPGTSGQQPGYNPQQYQAPLFVNGRVLMTNGQPVMEPISVGLECGMKPLQLIHTDLKGYFQFSLGTGAQSNMDFSASNDSPVSPMGGNSGVVNPQNQLTGCEVHVNVPGYVPLSRTITYRADVTGVELGTMQLTRIAGVTGSSISVTSMLVPGNARKEFEKGDKDARSNHLPSAAEHLEKAVAQYDKYAAAWFELGGVYASSKEMDKSRQAFEKSIEADPHYIPPYVSLANLQLQNNEFEPAIETAGKALDLDPTIGTANLIQAIGNFRLNRLDAAEKSAQQAEKGPHADMPDLHALHAQILLQEHDVPGAAAQMRAYLKEFPKGRFAAEIRTNLQQIDAADANSGSGSNSSQARIAP